MGVGCVCFKYASSMFQVCFRYASRILHDSSPPKIGDIGSLDNVLVHLEKLGDISSGEFF